MPKRPVPAGGAARSKAKASNIIHFPRRRGRPKAPVDPFTALARRLANPNRAAADLTRLIAKEHGRKLGDAIVEALILLTPPAQWPAHDWPPDIAWFHDYRMTIAGPMRGHPTLAGVKEILRQGRAAKW
jgi:hypothetical protein